MAQTEIVVTEWAETHTQPLTEEAVRKLYAQSERYRIGAHTYPSGTKFPAAAKQRTCYTIQGSWRYLRGTESWTLCAGQVAELPGGDYRLEVLGSDSLTIVHVFDLLRIAPSSIHRP